MAHGKSYRMHRSDSGSSRPLRLWCLWCLFCLLASLTACTLPGEPANHAIDLASTAPPTAETPPAAEFPPTTGVRQPPPTFPWSSSWSGIGGLVGNLGNLAGSNGMSKPGIDPPPAGAVHVTVYYATDRQYQASSRSYGWQPNRAAPHLSYGSVVVSIPEKRAPGELPLPP